MQIQCLKHSGVGEALLGLGLSYSLTSEYEAWEDLPEEIQERLVGIAHKLAGKGNGEDKFLRMVQFWWDAKFPRYLWQEVDQYRIGVTTQSESTIHTIMNRELTQLDFQYAISHQYLYHLNLLIKKYKETKEKDIFLKLKNALPEGFLQRRIWQLSLAQMLNIYRQRKSHRLPQWSTICEAFYEHTPYIFQWIYK